MKLHFLKETLMSQQSGNGIKRLTDTRDSEETGPPLAEVVRRADFEWQMEEPALPDVVHRGPQYKSWVFRCGQWVGTKANFLFGLSAMTLLLAVVANIPVLQLLSFGYLLESSGRVSRTGKFRSGFPGLRQASVIARGLLGTLICLAPLMIVANLWYSAHLIDPLSFQTRGLRILQFVLAMMTIPHVFAAWFCGGQFRHFIWPVIAPLSLGFWLIRKMLASTMLRPILGWMAGWISPYLLEDIGAVERLERWFLPAVLWDHLRRRTLWISARDRLWSFVESFRLGRLLELGLLGFCGTAIWLAIPTALLLVATVRESPLNVLVSVLGIGSASLVFSGLFFLQTSYAATGKFRSFFDFPATWRRATRAPIWFLVAVTISIVLALPLFLAKIEEIPRELMWTLSLFYVCCSWSSRVLLGWAYGRSMSRDKPRAWWWCWPTLSLIGGVSFVYAFILFFTRYLSWHGAWSTIENPVFLLPAPFWL